MPRYLCPLFAFMLEIIVSSFICIGSNEGFGVKWQIQFYQYLALGIIFWNIQKFG